MHACMYVCVYECMFVCMYVLKVTKKSHANYPHCLEDGPYKFQVVHRFTYLGSDINCLFIYLFFIFHRSKLGYNNLKDIEMVILLNTSNIKQLLIYIL